MMFNEQAAVFFLSGLKSRDEIDRYEWVFELALLLLYLQWNFD